MKGTMVSVEDGSRRTTGEGLHERNEEVKMIMGHSKGGESSIS